MRFNNDYSTSDLDLVNQNILIVGIAFVPFPAIAFQHTIICLLLPHAPPTFPHPPLIWLFYDAVLCVDAS